MANNVFKGQTFCFSGTLSMKRNEFEALVKKHGGACGASVTKKTTLLVTTQNEIDSATAKVVKAQELKDTCSIVSEDFVHESIKQKKLQDPKSYAVGGDAASSSSSSTATPAEAAPMAGVKRKAEVPMEKCSPKWVVTGTHAMFGIFVDDNLCMCGDENGWLLDVDHDTGTIKNKVKLPVGVKAIVRDRGGFLYAGCNDGSVYDCTDLAAPRLMKPAEDVNTMRPIQWADIYDGNLLINQSEYGCSMLNIEGEVVWTHPASEFCAWTVRTDTSKVYYSSDKDLIALDFATGKELWRRSADTSITFGVLYDKVMYVSEDGIAGIPTNETDPIVKYSYHDTFSSCAANEDYVFGGEKNIVMYDRKTGNIIKELQKNSGETLSMQIHNNRLYVVTEGTFECITLDNTNQKTLSVKFQPEVVATSSVVESIEVAAEAKAGEIICECIKEGGRLRIRPVSGGYNSSWNVQFPSNLREEGAKYVVEELLEAANGGYYRAKGSIKKLA